MQRKLCRLTASADEQKQASRGNPLVADQEVPAARQQIYLRVLHRAEVPRDGKQAEQESGVTHTIGNESLVRGRRCRVPLKIKPDQQIRAQAHPFPANEHQRIVVGQYERQHGKHEQVQVAEEAVVAVLMRHVADRINVDQHAHAGDEQQPDGRKRIEQEPGIGVELRGRSACGDVAQAVVAGAQPRVHDFFEWLAVVSSGIIGVLPDRRARERECQDDHANANAVDHGLLNAPSEKEHARCAHGGEQRYQPDVV